MSVEAPERIWLDVKAMSASSVAGRAPFFGVGYVRIDKMEELAAALRVAQGNTDSAIEDYNEAKAALAEKDKEIAALREALEKISARTRSHPDDTPEDDRRDKYHAHSIAHNAGGNNGE